MRAGKRRREKENEGGEEEEDFSTLSQLSDG
jgi:hypothetical protein